MGLGSPVGGHAIIVFLLSSNAVSKTPPTVLYNEGNSLEASAPDDYNRRY